MAGRDIQAATTWLLEQPQGWRDGITWGNLNLLGAYRRSFDVALPRAGQVADPFRVIRLGNNSIDETRRRVQNDTLGHRGRKHDPLYRVRRLVISAHERLAKVPTPNSRVCSPQAIPAARFVWRGTPKKPCEVSMTLNPRSSLRPTCVNSPITSPTVTAHRSCPGWAAPYVVGITRSSNGTTPGSPTARPKQSTI